MPNPEAPYFIKMKGCINCGASETLRIRQGNDYGFDHEVIAQCLIMGCVSHGFSLTAPYFDPEEVMRIAQKDGRPEMIENAEKYAKRIAKKFGKYCEDPA